MITSQILSNKTTTLNEKDNIKYVDLFTENFPDPFTDSFKFEIVTVDKKTEFKPLVLVQNIYNRTDFWDIFLKINDISNPFDIQSGDVLIAPDIDYLKNINISPQEEVIDVLNAVTKEINQSRASRNTNKRTKYLNDRRTKPTSGTDDGMNVVNDEVIIDTNLESESQTLKEEILKKALRRSLDDGNTVLSKQIANLLKCEIE